MTYGAAASDSFADVFGAGRGNGLPRSYSPRNGEYTYFIACRADGREHTFHNVLPSNRDYELVGACEWAGRGGSVEERGRKRINDYVGPPIWGNDRRIHTFPGIDRTPRS